jgi:hypothetical protein
MNYFTEYNVTSGPFSECSPRTEEGIRKLAYIVLAEHVYSHGAYIDELELLMLQAMRIRPEGYGSGHGRHEEIKPVEIEHVRKRGMRALKVRWLHSGFEDCDVCSGRGGIRAMGGDGSYHKFECPECCGSGITERDPEYIETDIDGLPWRLAA